MLIFFYNVDLFFIYESFERLVLIELNKQVFNADECFESIYFYYYVYSYYFKGAFQYLKLYGYPEIISIVCNRTKSKILKGDKDEVDSVYHLFNSIFFKY